MTSTLMRSLLIAKGKEFEQSGGRTVYVHNGQVVIINAEGEEITSFGGADESYVSDKVRSGQWTPVLPYTPTPPDYMDGDDIEGEEP
ncbi:MAG: hypothetical protein AB2A00_25065 [Myxococcota bacterium]